MLRATQHIGQHTCPTPQRHVHDGVGLTQHEAVGFEALLDQRPMTVGFVVVTIQRIFLGFWRGMAEMHRLPRKRPNARGNKHQPRQHLPTGFSITDGWDKSLLSVRQIHQNGVAIKHGRLTILERRQLRIRVNSQKVRTKLLAFACVHRYGIKRQTQLLKQQCDLHGVGGCVVIESQHTQVL